MFDELRRLNSELDEIPVVESEGEERKRVWKNQKYKISTCLILISHNISNSSARPEREALRREIEALGYGLEQEYGNKWQKFGDIKIYRIKD